MTTGKKMKLICLRSQSNLPFSSVICSKQQIIRTPLPTPRQTPSEASTSQARMGSLASQPSATQASSIRRENKQMPSSAPSSTPSDTTIVTPTDIPQTSQPMFSAFPAISGMQAFPPQLQMQIASMFGAMMPMAQIDPRAMAMIQAMQDIVSQVQPAMYNQSGQQSPIQEPVLPFPDVPLKPSEARSKRHSSGIYSSSSRRSFNDLSDNDSLTDKKGKRRASSPSAKRRKTSSSSYHATSASQPSTLAGNSSTLQSRVFLKSGRPVSFFVQIDLHNRGAVVDAIKVICLPSFLFYLAHDCDRKMVEGLKKTPKTQIMLSYILVTNIKKRSMISLNQHKPQESRAVRSAVQNMNSTPPPSGGANLPRRLKGSH